MTRSQNLAPSVLLEPQPKNLLGSVGSYAARDMNGLVANQPFVADFNAQGVEEHQRVNRLERAGLPGRDFVENGVGDRADQLRRDIDP